MRKVPGPGRWSVLAAIALAVAGAAAIGITPLFAGGKIVQTGFIGVLEGAVDFHGPAHIGRRDVPADRRALARCATPGYRAAHPSRCPRLTPVRARAERAQRARCERPRYRKRHRALCPSPTVRRVNQALKRSFAAGDPPAAIGRWSGIIRADGLPINAVLLPTGKVLWFAYPEKPDFRSDYDPNLDGGGPGGTAVNWAEAWVFDPATGTSVRRNPPIDPDTGKPFNIWCAGQTLLRDGRVLVAGGNKKYWSNVDQKYWGHDIVLTFNPFNETWMVQGRMQKGRWYPTLTELGDGRVVIVAGLDDEPDGQGDDNNPDIEVFTPSPNLDGVGTIQKVGERYFGLYPHVFLNPAGKLIVTGPDESDTAVIDPADWSTVDTPDLPAFGPQGGRREWGAATLLPSGPDGPSHILMNGGSPAEGTPQQYANASATSTSLLVNTLNGAITPAPSNVRARSHVNTTILPDGSLFSNGGGRGSSDNNLYAGPVYSAELRDPATGNWTETDPQADERTYHSTALLIPDGRVISMGDDRSDHSTNPAARTLEFYDPPYLYKGPRPAIESAPVGAPYGVPVGIGTRDAIAKAVLIKLGSRTHALDVDQRSIELPVAGVPGGVQFTTPANPNAAPPGYYMLFLLNGQGVPSVATMLRLDHGLAAPPALPGQGGGSAAGGGAAAAQPAPACKILPRPPSPRTKGEVAFTLTAQQLLINQRIGQAAIRRLNAVEDRLDRGLTSRDLCGYSVGPAQLGSGVVSAMAGASLAPVAPADPAPIADPGRRRGRGDPVTLSARQLLINQRVYQAAIRRADGITSRLEAGLTGGDIRNGQVTQGKLQDRLRVVSKAPAAEPASSDTAIPGRRRPGRPGDVALSVAQLRINQRIAQAGVRESNALIRRLETGLSGSDLRPGTLTAADLG